MHGFILSAAFAGEGFVKRFRLFAAFSHLSRAAEKQEREEAETSAETQGAPSFAPDPAHCQARGRYALALARSSAVSSLFAAGFVGALDGAAAARLLRRFRLGTERYAGAARLGEADRDRLLARARTIVAMFEAVHFFADELARGGGRALTGAQCPLGLLDGLLFGHAAEPLQPAHQAHEAARRRLDAHGVCQRAPILASHEARLLWSREQPGVDAMSSSMAWRLGKQQNHRGPEVSPRQNASRSQSSRRRIMQVRRVSRGVFDLGASCGTLGEMGHAHGWVLAIGLLAACSAHDATGSGAESAQSSAAAHTEVFRALMYECPKLTEPEASTQARRQVFTEVILMEGPSATVKAARVSDLSQLAHDPSLRMLAAPHYVGDLEQRGEHTLVEHIGVSREASLYRLSVLPRETSEGALVLELGITLQLPNPSGAAPAPTGSTTLTMTGNEQQLLLGSAPLPHRQDRALLALVKYWRIDDTQDLRSIFECKMRQRQHALSQKP